VSICSLRTSSETWCSLETVSVPSLDAQGVDGVKAIACGRVRPPLGVRGLRRTDLHTARSKPPCKILDEHLAYEYRSTQAFDADATNRLRRLQ